MTRILHSRSLLAGAAILALAATPAQQQHPAAAPPDAVAAAVGHWLYDTHGGIIGSVKAVSADGRTATIVIGVYLFDSVRVVEVPASTLSVMDGKARLQTGTAMALGFPSGG